MHICVIGTGYVGLVTGACFAEFGVQVACVDNVASKVAMLQEGQLPIHEPGLHELVNKNLREGRLTFTTDITKAIEQALVIFIAVGTPGVPMARPICATLTKSPTPSGAVCVSIRLWLRRAPCP